MSRKEDRIVSIEVILPRRDGERDSIIVVSWSDDTKSLWFANKAPKYVREIIDFCKGKGAYSTREVVSVKTTY